MLHHKVAGTGAPLVIIHGLFGSLENVGALARLLSRDFTVYSFDLPNHGRSPHSAGADLAYMAGAVLETTKQLGLSEAFWVGHSLGGKVAMEVALQSPAVAKALAVIDIAPVAYPPRHDDVFNGLHAIDPAALNSRAEAETILERHVAGAPVRSFLLKNLTRERDTFRWRMNLADLADQYPRLIDANRDGRFAGPVLFLKGADSNYLKPAHREAILQKFPKAEVKIVAQTGHWLHAEKPELTATLIKKFLQSVEDDQSRERPHGESNN